MTMHELCSIIIQYIENNKVKHNIDYEETIRAIIENVETIKEQYEEEGLI